MQEMKFEWYGESDAICAFMLPYFCIILKMKNSWTTKNIYYPLYKKICTIKIRVLELKYDKDAFNKNPKPVWTTFYFIRYEVQKNSYGILFIEYRKPDGWYLIGININLARINLYL